MSLPAVAWDEVLDKVDDPFLYANFCAGIGSGGVVWVLSFPCRLVSVAVDVLFHFRYLSVVGSLWYEQQYVRHAIGFF